MNCEISLFYLKNEKSNFFTFLFKSNTPRIEISDRYCIQLDLGIGDRIVLVKVGEKKF